MSVTSALTISILVLLTLIFTIILIIVCRRVHYVSVRFSYHHISLPYQFITFIFTLIVNFQQSNRSFNQQRSFPLLFFDFCRLTTQRKKVAGQYSKINRPVAVSLRTLAEHCSSTNLHTTNYCKEFFFSKSEEFNEIVSGYYTDYKSYGKVQAGFKILLFSLSESEC